MKEYITSKYDFEAMRKNFIENGFLVYKPAIPEDVLNGASEFTDHVLNRCARATTCPATAGTTTKTASRT